MIPRNLEHLTPLLVLGVVLLFWLIAPVVVKSTLRSGFHEFKAPILVSSSVVHDIQSYWSLRTSSKRSLIEAGREMARVKAAREVSLRRLSHLAEENLRLRTLLGIPEDPEFHYEIARVIQRDLNSWWQRLVLRKGRDYGIIEGAGVIFEDGVVGRVREVHAYTSVVELVTSPAFQMAARFEGDNRPVRFRGGKNPSLRDPGGSVHDVPADLQASPDQPLTLEATPLGGVFPAGMVVGRVEGLEPGPDGLFQVGEVRLPESLLTIEEATILIPISAREHGAPEM